MSSISLVVCLAAAAPAAPKDKKKSGSGSKAGAEAGRKKSKKKASAWPPFEDRHGDFLRRLGDANANGLQAPDPLSQYLVDELVVTGLFETEGGYGAFFLATPSGNTFFAAPGVAVYNGQFREVRIGRPGYLEDVRVVFTERAGGKGGERMVLKEVVGAEPKVPPPAAQQPAPPPAAPKGEPQKPSEAPADEGAKPAPDVPPAG